MTREIIVCQVEGAVAVRLPQDFADRLRIGPGDKLYATETNGGILLTPHDPRFEAGMEAFRRVLRQYHETFKRLAE
jgi:putative addiction module antidote